MTEGTLYKCKEKLSMFYQKEVKVGKKLYILFKHSIVGMINNRIRNLDIKVLR